MATPFPLNPSDVQRAIDKLQVATITLNYVERTIQATADDVRAVRNAMQTIAAVLTEMRGDR